MGSQAPDDREDPMTGYRSSTQGEWLSPCR